MTKHIAEMLSRMTESNITHALILKPQNIRYLTGYTGEGSLMVSGEGATILTDFRYIEQAGRQAPEAKVIRYTGQKEHYQLVKDLLGSASSLAVEQDYLTMKEGQALSDALGSVALTDINEIPEALRIVKDEEELECIRAACKISCAAFDHILGFIKPGLTEKEIQLELEYTMFKMGSEALAFDTIACAGENGSLPHAIPSDRKVRSGELLTMDFGAQVRGYKSDMTRTVGVGKVSDTLRTLYETVLEAQLRALDMIRPGVKCMDVDKCARDFLESRYPGAFGHSLGHGVGLNIHEQPSLSMRDERYLVPGHVVTVEPGVYLPGVGGCRIEDMGAVTESGFDDYITAPKQLIEL